MVVARIPTQAEVAELARRINDVLANNEIEIKRKEDEMGWRRLLRKQRRNYRPTST